LNAPIARAEQFLFSFFKSSLEKLLQVCFAKKVLLLVFTNSSTESVQQTTFLRQKSERKFLSRAHSILGWLHGKYRAKLGAGTLQDLARVNMCLYKERRGKLLTEAAQAQKKAHKAYTAALRARAEYEVGVDLSESDSSDEDSSDDESKSTSESGDGESTSQSQGMAE